MELIKLNPRQRKQLIKLINTMNKLLDINSTSKIKNTISKLDLDHEHKSGTEFDYGKNFIRIYSMSEEWQVYNDYEEIYFDLKLCEFDELDITSNCKTPFDYIPQVVKIRIKNALKYLADNSSDLIRKINLIIDEDNRNVALNEFLPRKHIKL